MLKSDRVVDASEIIRRATSEMRVGNRVSCLIFRNGSVPSLGTVRGLAGGANSPATLCVRVRFDFGGEIWCGVDEVVSWWPNSNW